MISNVNSVRRGYPYWLAHFGFGENMLTGLVKLLTSNERFIQLAKDLTNGQEKRLSILEAAKPLLLIAIWKMLRVPVLVVCPRPEDARYLYDILSSYLGESIPIHHFVDMETLPFERLTPDTPSISQRLHAMSALSSLYKEQEPAFVVTSASGLAMRNFSPELLLKESQVIRRGDTLSMDVLLNKWVFLGYKVQSIADVPGTLSRRGGILDIFPIDQSIPTRMEFYGNTIDSMRTFDPVSQLTIDFVDKVFVIPARELLTSKNDPELPLGKVKGLDFSNLTPSSITLIEEELDLLSKGYEVKEPGFYAGFYNQNSITDFLPKEGLIVLDQVSEIEESLDDLDKRITELRETKTKRGDIPKGFPSPYLDKANIMQSIRQKPRRLNLSRWGTEDHETLPFEAITSFRGNLDNFLTNIRENARKGDRVIVVTNYAKRLRKLKQDHELGAHLTKDLRKLPNPHSVTLIEGSLTQGWTLNTKTSKVLLFSDTEIFGMRKFTRPRQQRSLSRQKSPTEMIPGIYVVHIDHGIAQFVGTTTVQEDRGEKEYLELEYAEGDKLYVPTQQIDRVSLYSAPGNRPPRLTRLGTQEWSRIKDRVKQSVLDMAEELINVHAIREASKGIGFDKDLPWQRELEDSFPYSETKDQIMAIAEIKADMEKPKPMDRLICGDVGYGKTEVALRAAFKAVMSGTQVAILVPTTVLAQQHHDTFNHRLSPFPVKVEMLSRFRTKKEQLQVIDGLAKGEVDICIGTHRLLQKDVSFKNLGLVVVDEEQRFGVIHKERLKQFKQEVDILTLSATPIPRTLHMALSGIREISTMETPPENRLPIRTYVSEYSEDLIREAIFRELDRGGQVYLVHNRIHNITEIAKTVSRLVPEAIVSIAHGRMPEEKLEEVMSKFASKKTNVLICTTIIEAGLDLPNVNTLIINRADTFGLSQLYQLRGRIGRGSNRAHAYLLIPRHQRITEVSKKRLETILTATELGAGFQIAMKDLEIRGAGNILGAQQSGNIHSIGFELYSQLLSEAVEEVKATSKDTLNQNPLVKPSNVTLDLEIQGRIPAEYIEDTPTRLNLYQRLSKIQTINTTHEIHTEFQDRFGPLPQEVKNLLFLIKLRILAEKAKVASISRNTQHTNEITIRLLEDVGGAKLFLQKTLLNQDLSITVGNHLLHLVTSRETWRNTLLYSLEQIISFQDHVIDIANSYSNLKEARVKVPKEIRHATADKDVSENSPLDVAREQQGHIEARIREPENTLRRATLLEKIDKKTLRKGKVTLGSRVTIRHKETRSETSYLLVNTNEADPSKGKLSVESPVGKALVSRSLGETVEVSTPSGQTLYEISKLE